MQQAQVPLHIVQLHPSGAQTFARLALHRFLLTHFEWRIVQQSIAGMLFAVSWVAELRRC